MNINKSKLKKGLWYEDKDGNYIPYGDLGKTPSEAVSCCSCFPLEITTHIRVFYDNKDSCRHPLKYRKRTDGWVKGIKGCKCTCCGKEKVGKSKIPFMFMKWENGASSKPLMTSNVNIGGGNEDVILAMANSGDYTLSEALVIYASACERCANALAYKYLNGKDGYEEMSDEWKKCGTVCDFCRDMGYEERSTNNEH